MKNSMFDLIECDSCHDGWIYPADFLDGLSSYRERYHCGKCNGKGELPRWEHDWHEMWWHVARAASLHETALHIAEKYV